MNGPKSQFKPRKKPRQERARLTFEAILDASAQLLTAHPERELDTNEIAVRAGVSIGSLYQYFPNQGAILAALSERHLERKLGDLQRLLDGSSGALDMRITPILRWLVAGKHAEAELERALYVSFYRYGDLTAIAAIDAPLLTTLTKLLSQAGHGVRAELRAFVLLQALRGALLSASLLRPESLADGTLQTELDALARGYLQRALGDLIVG